MSVRGLGLSLLLCLLAADRAIAQLGGSQVISPGTGAADLEAADVLVVVPNDGPQVWAMARQTVEKLGSRRGVVFSFAILGRAVEDPLTHFQMGHTSEAELLAEAKVSPAEWARYKPLVDLAVSRQWPIVPSDEGAVSPEIERIFKTPTANARPLVVWVTRPGTNPDLIARIVRGRLPNVRVVNWAPRVVMDSVPPTR